MNKQLKKDFLKKKTSKPRIRLENTSRCLSASLIKTSS